MKKVLIFSLAYVPRVGGAEVALQEITDRISPIDIEFHMITLRFDRASPRAERIGNIFVHRIGSGDSRIAKFLYQFHAARMAGRLHRREGFNVVWAMMAHSAGVPAALFSLRHPDVPFLLTLQEGDPPAHIERTMRPLWPLFKRAFTRAARVQAISHFLADWARRMGATAPIDVIPNGVDTARFAGSRVPHEGTVLITVSRLVSKNAVDDVIRALPYLPPQVVFAIAGTGPEEASLRSLARELKVENRVRFVGHVSQQDLPHTLAACDIFIRPSRSEGQGIAFIEAMAAGLPVIATQEGGIGDFLFDAKRNPEKPSTGFAVDKDAPEEIAEAVRRILDKPEDTKRTIAEAHRLVREQYDWNLIVEKMRALFATLGV